MWMPFVLGFSLSAALPSQAEKLFAEKNFTAAQKIYEQRLTTAANNATLHYNLGCVEGTLKRYDAAVEHLEKALQSTPDVQFRAYNNLGYSCYRMGQQYLAAKDREKTIQVWEKSLNFYQNALELDPKSERTRHDYEWVKKELEKLKQQQKTDSKNSEQPKHADDQPQKQNSDSESQQNQQRKGEQDNQQARPQGAMTQAEAEQLLNLAKGDEKTLPSQRQEKPTATTREAKKDW